MSSSHRTKWGWAAATALSGSLWIAGPSAFAQTIPAPAALSIEERLQKLEAMNQQLSQQNQELNSRLKEIAGKLAPASPTAPVSDPPSTDANTIRTQPTTGSAVGGGDLMSPATGGPADRSAAGGNTIESVPSRGSSFGGGDLISFDPNDPSDATGVKMLGRFGRRFTNNGLWFESPDKVFQFHVGGRTQMDTSFFSADNTVQYGPRGIGPLRDGIDARRMRLRVEGAMYENTLFCTEFDFVNSSIPQGRTGAGSLTSVSNTPAAGVPVPLDLWVTFRNIPYIGHIRIGNQKEPIGFERLTSSRFLNFMERSFNQDAFYGPYDNGFVPGISTFSTYADRRGTYAVGLFKNVTNPYAYDVGGGNYKVTGRITGLLLDKDDGLKLMHLGISGRQSGYDNGQQRFRVRGPERAGISTVWPLYANTGVFNGSGGQQDINLESVNVFGPWTIDAEYLMHWSQDAFLPGKPSMGALFYSGGYVEALYFLTGENRAYVRESGNFDRVVPRKNAYWVKGKKGAPNEHGYGAWQVGIRYNYLNLNDKGIDGGVLNDLTFGLNWFVNPNMKFQANYSITNRHSPGALSDGLIQGFGMRYAVDF
ncbi:MAG: oprO 1 [Planctomycetota bacterium]|nr:oprO 1 [Planctomycetota bacterium]